MEHLAEDVLKILITGGAGFIGCNTARHYLERGDEVVVLDNFSRKGALTNIRWLQENFGVRLRIVPADIRVDRKRLAECVQDVDVVFHRTAQVAVTTSVVDPREDFEINALVTFNVLEAVREVKSIPASAASRRLTVRSGPGCEGVMFLCKGSTLLRGIGVKGEVWL